MSFKTKEEILMKRAMKKTVFKPLMLMLTGIMLLFCVSPGFSQEKKDEQKEDVERIAIIGTRAAPRSVIDSAVPLDIIFADELRQQGPTNMLNIIKTVVPSFNVGDYAINDAATMVRPANLRGMASDHTLVLVEGKRRHRASVISFLDSGLSLGAQGPDISAIPGIALKQVEVLRDGASAQYGSDAIAGVINFDLKDADHGGFVEIKQGRYYEGDGDTTLISGNVGMPLTDKGFVNLSFEYQDIGPTSRSVQQDGAIALIEAGNTHVIDPVQVWGTPDVSGDIKVFVNSGLEINSQMKTYLFGNYSERDVFGGFYFRHPHIRSGVYDLDGTPDNLLVGDLDGVGQGIECPTIAVGDNVLDNPDYQLIADDTTEVGRNCFAFNELFPGGFTPNFGGTIKDMSVVAGLKGEAGADWEYDLSASWGNNRVDHVIRNTINASLAGDTPTVFKPASYVQDEKSVNLDVVKGFEMWSRDMSFAAGLEYRSEFFHRIAGDPKSYEVGPLADQGFLVGSNGFPGLSERYAGKEDRTSSAVYVDVETYPLEELLLTGALRYENFSDFGDNITGKVSTHYSLNSQYALRGAVSTGFKAPTIGQTTVRTVTTQYSGGVLIDRVTLPPSDPVAQFKGAKKLQPETSVNFSLGTVGQISNNLFLTVDYFRIKVKDRLSITSGVELTEEDKEDLLNRGVEDASSFSEVNFYANDFSTVTQGVDIVTTYNTSLFLVAALNTFLLLTGLIQR